MDVCCWLSGVGESGTPVTSVITSTVKSDYDDNNLAVIIGVSVAAAVLLVIAASLLTVLACRVHRRRAADSYHSHRVNYDAWETDDAVAQPTRQSLFSVSHFAQIRC